MGLDTYARIRRGSEVVDLDDSLFSGIHLIGGMCSGGSGSSGFRGKCYDEVVEEITGITLYQEEILPHTVKAMAAKISKHVGEQPDCKHLENDWDCESCSLANLKRWFQVAAENDATLIGWW